ncbi:protein of unknown function DUF20 [Cyclonatronum proteinivorum]|uniref:PurR-regulated permease PerM n=1 Tax=Cyclonatronum proteinivorum TaxID=1457365 RepID=A0A345UMU8_9BACT|nr:AI-2E family transporter [Cyclonatronum proteinivorum]AXJ01800.1 protein of unknown function DUF20 [Cyclonatronum proteinivorum]
MRNPQSDTEVKRRTRTYVLVSSIVFLLTTGYVLWSIRPLLLPVVFGALLAYVSQPVVALLIRRGFPKLLSVLLFVTFFITLLFYAFVFVKNQIPDRDEQAELRTVAMYQLNERYESLIETSEQNTTFAFGLRFLMQETHPLIDNLNFFLALEPEEQRSFEARMDSLKHTSPRYGRMLQYHRENQNLRLYTSDLSLSEAILTGQRTINTREPADQEREGGSTLLLIFGFFSTWLIMPVIFFFLLLDEGRFRRKLISMVPNIFFETALTSLYNVDKAIGSYLRGTLLESLAVFTAFLILLSLIGFNFTVSVLIGIVAAVANIIPFIGPAVGIILVIAYALIIDEINSILPFINTANLVYFAGLAAILIQVLDNMLLKPLILGGATDLHPILVFFVVVAGGVMFGFWGVLFSIPVIVIIKVSATTIHERLLLYQIIRL